MNDDVFRFDQIELDCIYCSGRGCLRCDEMGFILIETSPVEASDVICVSKMRCPVCNFSQICEYPAGLDKLECGNCGFMMDNDE